MEIVQCCGFEGRDIEMDGLLVLVAGVGNYSGNAPLPPDSKSTQYISAGNGQRFLRYFHQGATSTGTPYTITGQQYGFHFRIRSLGVYADTPHCSLSNGVDEVVGVSFTASNEVTIRVGGSVVATSPVAVSSGEWERFHVTVDNQIGGLVSVFIDGDLTAPIVSYTLLSVMPNPNAFKFGQLAFTTSNWYYDDLVAWEMGIGDYADNINLLGSVSVERVVLNSNGHYTGWEDGAGNTGVYTAIDEVPPNDSDLIDADAVDLASTYGNAGVTDDVVFFLQGYMRSLRNGTAAGEHIQLRQRHAGIDEDLPATATAAPADGHVIIRLPYNAEGNTWNPTRVVNSEFGPVSRT